MAETTKVPRDVEELVRDSLMRNGFDGLFNVDEGCACTVNELATCGDIQCDCEPGVTGPCDCGEPMAVNRDSSDPENREQWEQWLATHAWRDLENHAVMLAWRVEELERKIEEMTP